MSDDKQQNSAETERAQNPTAIPEEQLGDIAGGGFGLGGKTVRGDASVRNDVKVKDDVKLRDEIKVKRDGYGLGG